MTDPDTDQFSDAFREQMRASGDDLPDAFREQQGTETDGFKAQKGQPTPGFVDQQGTMTKGFIEQQGTITAGIREQWSKPLPKELCRKALQKYCRSRFDISLHDIDFDAHFDPTLYFDEQVENLKDTYRFFRSWDSIGEDEVDTEIERAKHLASNHSDIGFEA